MSIHFSYLLKYNSGVLKLIVFDDTIIVSEENTGKIPKNLISSANVITCGLSQKSAVTASSINDYGFVYCIQRGFFTGKCFGANLLLPQEFNITWNRKTDNINYCLETVTLMLLCGADPSDISKNVLFID